MLEGLELLFEVQYTKWQVDLTSSTKVKSTEFPEVSFIHIF